MLSIVSVPAAASSAAQETPLWRLVLENVPFDPTAIVLYLILGGSAWLIWWGHRHSGGAPRQEDPDPGLSAWEDGVEAPSPSKPRGHGRGRAA